MSLNLVHNSQSCKLTRGVIAYARIQTIFYSNASPRLHQNPRFSFFIQTKPANPPLLDVIVWVDLADSIFHRIINRPRVCELLDSPYFYHPRVYRIFGAARERCDVTRGCAVWVRPLTGGIFDDDPRHRCVGRKVWVGGSLCACVWTNICKRTKFRRIVQKQKFPTFGHRIEWMKHKNPWGKKMHQFSN